MKLGELIKLLKKNGFTLKREGANHSIYWKSSDGTEITIPRHAKEIATGTLNSILKDAGLK